jgi:hypothetical protein
LTGKRVIRERRIAEQQNKTLYTQEVYTGFITQWITPKWGQSPLSDIKDSSGGILAPYFETSQRNMGKNTQHHVGPVFTRDAMGVLFRNPITMVRQSARRDRTPEVLTADELKALLAELARVYRVGVCGSYHSPSSLGTAGFALAGP